MSTPLCNFISGQQEYYLWEIINERDEWSMNGVYEERERDIYTDMVNCNCKLNLRGECVLVNKDGTKIFLEAKF